MREIIISSLSILSVCGSYALADVILMGDGREITGHIVAEDSQSVIVDAMVRGIRAKLQLPRQEIREIRRGELPEGFFESQAAATQPASATQPAGRTPAMEGAVKEKIGRLTSEIESLRKDIAECQKQLRAAPATVRKTYRVDPRILDSRILKEAERFKPQGGTPFQPVELGPRDRYPHGGEVVDASTGLPLQQVDEPNQEIPTLKEKIRKARHAISAKNQEIADLRNPAIQAVPPQSQVAMERLREDIKSLRENLAELRGKLAETPPQTDWHRVSADDTVGTLFRKHNPEPNPAYTALEKRIREIQDSIAAKNRQLLDITNGGTDGHAALDARRQAEVQGASEKAEGAEKPEKGSEAFSGGPE
jgi:hypothetical protein